jgi:hypothetical protein
MGGFANFAMSLNNDAHDISAPGQYRIVAYPAHGWTVTSGNASQDLSIEALNGSPGGLIVKGALLPVGVAPVLSIRGTLEATADGNVSSYVVTASSEGKESREVVVSAEGAYEFTAENGLWRLDFNGPKVPVATRVVAVSGYPVAVSTVEPGVPCVRRSGKETAIGFDDLTHSDTLYKIPNGYGGLNWHNWISTHQKFYKGHGYLNGTVSGEYVAYNGSGHPAAISMATPFDFLGAHVSVAWTQAERGSIDIQGWRGNQRVYRDRITTSTSGPVKFDACYTDVTRVEFSTQHYWQVLIDDLMISVPSTPSD